MTQELRERIGRVGLWTAAFEMSDSPTGRQLARDLEGLGYQTVWIPEALGRDALVHAAMLLSATDTLQVATGIASIWGRDSVTMSAGHKTLTEWFPDRFTLGLGVSHEAMVAGLRGRDYSKPFSAMKEFLTAMDAAPYLAPRPKVPPRRVLAALGPRMLNLAAEQADGVHPYFVPVEHTAFARKELGDAPVLAPEQAVVLETDPDTASAVARSHMGLYLSLPNYTNNLRRLGWGDDDLSGGGSDRLVDAIVAWGDVSAIGDRVAAHHDAGADHVALQVLTSDPSHAPIQEWEALASALL